jgi:hypothetical protein
MMTHNPHPPSDPLPPMSLRAFVVNQSKTQNQKSKIPQPFTLPHFLLQSPIREP